MRFSFWSIKVRPIYRRALIALVVVLSIGLLVALFSYYRFGSNPRLAYGLFENCEAAVLKLVKNPDDVVLLRARIFPEGLETLPVADTTALEVRTRYKTIVERGQGRFIYPAIKLAFRATNDKGAPQNEEVTCQYGGVKYKDGTVLSMRLMYVDLGPASVKNPFVYREDGYQSWVSQGIEEWVELDDMTPTAHWKHFLDRRIKVLEWEGSDGQEVVQAAGEEHETDG